VPCQGEIHRRASALFKDCRPSGPDEYSAAFSSEVAAVVEKGADLTAVLAALREAYEHALADNFQTKHGILKSRVRLEKHKKTIRTNLRRAASAAIELHKQLDPHRLAPELVDPYRRMLELAEGGDVLLTPVPKRRRGNPNRGWVTTLTYPKLRAAGVSQPDAKYLLQLLGLITDPNSRRAHK
jgi:hypothetical protein